MKIDVKLFQKIAEEAWVSLKSTQWQAKGVNEFLSEIFVLFDRYAWNSAEIST
jgi:hypothetical protein